MNLKANALRRILSLLLCLTLMGAVISMVACNTPEGEESTDGATEAPTEEAATELPLNENGMVNVVVFSDDAPKGTKVSTKNLEVIELPAENIPRNVVTSIDDVKGMYTNRDFYKGDYVIAKRLVKTKPLVIDDSTLKEEITKTSNEFVVVTDFIKPNTGEDLYTNLQMLIDKNPGRTLYFPDGEYVISHSLQTTSEPEKSTSFYFSSGAVLRAADNWSNDGNLRALICLGSYERVNDINTPGSNFYIIGGTFIANGRGDGIALFYGRETLIKDVVVLNARYGIHIVHATNNTSSDEDIDDVTIVGNGLPGSVGIVASGLDNTYTNVRVSNVQTGMILSDPAFASNCTVENTSGLDNSVGFSARGDCWYSDCVSIDFDEAFIIGGNSGFLKQCTAIWPSNAGEQHVAFRADRLNASLYGCKAIFEDDSVPNYFLKASDVGSGRVMSPIFNISLVASDDKTAAYLFSGSKIINLPATKKED